jgi:hypothetical protein
VRGFKVLTPLSNGGGDIPFPAQKLNSKLEKRSPKQNGLRALAPRPVCRRLSQVLSTFASHDIPQQLEDVIWAPTSDGCNLFETAEFFPRHLDCTASGNEENLGRDKGNMEGNIACGIFRVPIRLSERGLRVVIAPLAVRGAGLGGGTVHADSRHNSTPLGYNPG